jgi:hypothetical protein
MRNGQPTGYSPEQVHPDLCAHADVLNTKEELSRWLESSQISEQAA